MQQLRKMQSALSGPWGQTKQHQVLRFPKWKEIPCVKPMFLRGSEETVVPKK